MTITREFLEGIREEAGPLIRQAIDLSERFSDIRKRVADEGGDWSALKALLKAEILDEEGGDHIKKLVGRIDESTQYAAMLGLGGVNNKNFSSSNPAPVSTSSRIDSVSFETAASETAARSPSLKESRGSTEGRAAEVQHRAKVAPSPAASGRQAAEREGATTPPAGFESGPRDTFSTGKGPTAVRDTSLSVPMSAAAGDGGRSAAATDCPESEPMGLPASDLGRRGADGDTVLATGSPPISSDPLSIPVAFRREPNDRVWSS